MKHIFTIAAAAAVMSGSISCTDTARLESDLAALEDRVAALEETVSKVNDNIIAAYTLYESGLIIMAVHSFDNGTVYRLDMSDGTSVDLHIATEDGKGITPVIGIDADGNWTVALGDDAEPEVIPGMPSEGLTPQLRVSDEGNWQISYDGGSSWEDITDGDGNPFPATGTSLTDSFFTDIVYNEENGTIDIVTADGQELSLNVHSGIITMEVEGYEEGMSILLNEALHLYAEFSPDVDGAYAECPEGWRVQITETEDGRQEIIVTAPSEGIEGNYEITVYLQSEEKYLRAYTFTFHLNPVDIDEADSEAWNRFLSQSEDNVLLDFSYAGYKHGETAPPDVMVYEAADGTCTTNLAGYTVYNIKDYQTDGRTDREAFMAAVEAAAGAFALTNDKSAYRTDRPKNNGVNAIIYFPPGRYVLHTEADNENDGSGSSPSKIIRIRGSNIIMKGAGRDQTTIIMEAPNLPKDPEIKYSSPTMLEFKHDSAPTRLTDVIADAPQGSFEVQVASASDISEGDWVCLWLENNDNALIAQELAPHTVQSYMTDILNNGVQVIEYHQVKSVSGNTLTFHEPLMKTVEAKWQWEIRTYPHYENIGIEDITFEGNAKESFVHHAGWEDDGAYKPVDMIRLVNSWIRRVRFTSVSEACSIVSCANVSAYDIEFTGNRGHAAVRSQASSRVFIGATTDRTSGYAMDTPGHDVTGQYLDNAGQYHAVGVSKQSIGAVLWRNIWGDDSCFEAHATQPRATLIDCCTGSMRRWRQGGDDAQMPNHMSDLIIWNFYNTTGFTELQKFIWWDTNSSWWKILPPVIVGFHGTPVTFDESPGQIKYIESNGTAVTPESLYEAQLRRRLGYVPAWLTALK